MDFYFKLDPILRLVIQGLAVILVMFPIAGACSLAERKVSAWIQGRPGPNRAIVPWFAAIPVLGRILQRIGVFHLMADGGKLLIKEDPLPGHVHKAYFMAAPLIALIPAFTTATVIPFGAYWDATLGAIRPLMLANVDVGILAVFAIGSLGVYSSIIAGWSSNSKYSFLGGIRASAQLISYELSLTLAVVPVFLWINSPGSEGSLSLARVVEFQSGTSLTGGLWFIFVMPLSALIFMIALFAETNRLPFDMAESEADLVSGFHTEYGSFKWSLFFVAEYAHMTAGGALFAVLFLGGCNPLPWVPMSTVTQLLHLENLPLVAGILSIAIFLVKVIAVLFFFMWVRWTVPRFRYDQVMKIGWQMLLPLAIGNLLFYFIAIYFIQG